VCVQGIIILYQKGNDHIGTGHIAVKLFGAGSPTDRLWSWDQGGRTEESHILYRVVGRHILICTDWSIIYR